MQLYNGYKDHIRLLLRPGKPILRSKSPSHERVLENEGAESRNDMSKYSNSLSLSRIDMTAMGPVSGASTPNMGNS